MPRKVKSKTLELTRGSHRSQSMSIGRGNGDIAELALDPADVRFLAAHAAYQNLLEKARRAVADALREQDAILNVRRVKKTDDDDKPELDVWCSSCKRVDHFSPRADQRRAGQENTLCNWCLQFERVHGFIPPVELLRVRVEKDARGQRVTEKDLTECGVTGDVTWRLEEEA